MCSACAIMRPRSSKSAVEQSRRSLMFAEKAERMSTAPISSATERRRAAENLELDIHDRVSLQPASCPIPNPHPPGGSQQVAPSSSSTAGPVTARARPSRRSSSAGPGATSAVRTATSSIRRVPVGVAVALLVRAVERLREIGPERHRQLERLACVAEVRLAVAPAARRPPRAGRRTSARGRAARRSPRARARTARRLPPGRARVAISSSSASSHACSGPAPPNATSAKSARIVPTLDRDDAATRAASPRSRHRRPRPGRSRRAHARPPRGRARAARERVAAAGPAARFASVTVGRVPPRP